MKCLVLALVFAVWGASAEASARGTCSAYLPATVYQSLNFTDAGWQAVGTTATTGTPAAPTCGAGITSVDDTSTGFHSTQRGGSGSMPASTYTLTVFAKRVVGTRNLGVVAFDPTFSSNAFSQIDLGACSVHASGGSAFTVISATAATVNGWCKIGLTFTTPANYNTGINPQFLHEDGSFSNTYSGDGTSSIALWGFDVRQTKELITIGDSTDYHTGFYTGFMAPFGGGTELTPNQMQISPPLFPGGTTFRWNYSSTPCLGVCGYLAIDYANYSGTTPAVPVPPIQVNNLPAATLASDLVFSGDITGFDAIYDTFLYTTSAATTRAVEIQVFLHTNAVAAAYVLSQTPVGTTTISGIVWTVTLNPNAAGIPDVLFMPSSQADVLSGTIDLLAMMNYAKAQGIITGNEWFSGSSIGAEPQFNAGAMAVNSFSAISPIIIGDNTNYYSGSYTGYLAPFSGVEVTPNTMTLNNPALFPGSTTIAWNYSSTPCVGVCGFLAVDYGNYSGTVAETPIPVIQVNNLATMTETHDLTFGGSLDDYDVIDDLFLYSDAIQSARSKEFIIFLHTNTQAANFVNAAPTQYGTTTISSVLWKVACYCASSPSIILFMPNSHADVAIGTVDINAMFTYAKVHGAITGNEYFTGMGLGAEPVANAGTMTINSFSAVSH